MKRLFILIFSIVIAGELEVDGDLKVHGTVDAQGNPITNVGATQTLTDAVNAGILASALSDDGVYEYKFILLAGHHTASNTLIYKKMDEADVTAYDNLTSYMNSLELEGWEFLRGSIMSFGGSPLLLFRKEING